MGKIINRRSGRYQGRYIEPQLPENEAMNAIKMLLGETDESRHLGMQILFAHKATLGYILYHMITHFFSVSKMLHEKTQSSKLQTGVNILSSTFNFEWFLKFKEVEPMYNDLIIKCYSSTYQTIDIKLFWGTIAGEGRIYIDETWYNIQTELAGQIYTYIAENWYLFSAEFINNYNIENEIIP